MNFTKCEMCSQIKDCKPAGINGDTVCLSCAKKNPKALRLFFLRNVGFTEEDEKRFFSQDEFNAYEGDSTANAVGEAVCRLLGRIISKAHEMGVDIKSVESKVIDSFADEDRLSVTFQASNGRLATLLEEENPTMSKPNYPLPGKYDA